MKKRLVSSLVSFWYLHGWLTPRKPSKKWTFLGSNPCFLRNRLLGNISGNIDSRIVIHVADESSGLVAQLDTRHLAKESMGKGAAIACASSTRARAKVTRVLAGV
ncbi:hypothetical protein N7497_002038 [Penicillium chrysogenum]|nr:hypothetical protein N7497_002038 [Penicillium chrysogenum]